MEEGRNAHTKMLCQRTIVLIDVAADDTVYVAADAVVCRHG